MEVGPLLSLLLLVSPYLELLSSPTIHSILWSWGVGLILMQEGYMVFTDLPERLTPKGSPIPLRETSSVATQLIDVEALPLYLEPLTTLLSVRSSPITWTNPIAILLLLLWALQGLPLYPVDHVGLLSVHEVIGITTLDGRQNCIGLREVLEVLRSNLRSRWLSGNFGVEPSIT